MKIKCPLHDRQETALILFAKLGTKYRWLHMLADWARGRSNGLKGCGPALLPFGQEKKKPRYHPDEIARFVEAALKFDPDLGPSKFAPAVYEIDEALLHPLVPWTSRNVHRPTSTTLALP